MSDVAAAREYERTHWGDTGRAGKPRVGRAANPAHGTAVELGELVSVTYRTRKGKGRRVRRYDYEHDFEDQLPTLAYNEGGLLVVGGAYTIRKGGITG